MHPCWEHHLLPSGVEVFGNRLSGRHVHAAQIFLGRADSSSHEGFVQHQLFWVQMYESVVLKLSDLT